MRGSYPVFWVDAHGRRHREYRSIDTHWTNLKYGQLFPGKKNLFLGGRRSHGRDFGNDYVLSKEPDWDKLLKYGDVGDTDYPQQLASFVHDYLLATAKNMKGIRLANEIYARHIDTRFKATPFFRANAKTNIGGFTVKNLKPKYALPWKVLERLDMLDDYTEHSFNRLPDATWAPEKRKEKFEYDRSAAKKLKFDDLEEEGIQHDLDKNIAGMPDDIRGYIGLFPQSSNGLTDADFEKLDDESVMSIAENFGDNDRAINLHTVHKNKNTMSKTRSLPVTNVQIGPGNKLQSVPSVLSPYYKGSRSLSTSWHHSGTSELDKREVFTYVFRHTVKQPQGPGDFSGQGKLLTPGTEVQNPVFGTSHAADSNLLMQGVFRKDGNSSVGVKPITAATWDGNAPLSQAPAGVTGNDNKPNLDASEKTSLLISLNNRVDAEALAKYPLTNGTRSDADQELYAEYLSYWKIPEPSKPELYDSKDYRLPFYRTIERSGVRLISAENAVMDESSTFESTIDSSEVKFRNSTWYSPYCLQELETLSWNINRMKLVPQPRGNYDLSKISHLPGRLLKDALLNADDFVDDANNLIIDDDKESTGAFGVYKNKLYDPQSASASPIHDMGLKYGKIGKYMDMHAYNDHYTQNPLGHMSEVADFKCQFGKSYVVFTFVNTGDTTMVVDMVVHRAKEHMRIGSSSIGAEGFPKARDITSMIVKPYAENYINFHRLNQTRKVSNDVPKAIDVYDDPMTKFLPTSYRLPKAGVIPKTVEGDDTATEDLSFIDIERRSCIIGPNTRKTIKIVMPTQSYVPSESNYSGLLNEHGIAVTFSVTGKSTKAVADTLDDDKAAVTVGKLAAPTSFHIYGREVQQVYPCAIDEYLSELKQLHSLPSVEMASGQNEAKKRLHSAVYIGPNVRDIKGRYAELLIDDGTKTLQQRHQANAADMDIEHRVRLDEIADSQSLLQTIATNTGTAPTVNVTLGNLVVNSQSVNVHHSERLYDTQGAANQSNNASAHVTLASEYNDSPTSDVMLSRVTKAIYDALVADIDTQWIATNTIEQYKWTFYMKRGVHFTFV